MDKGKQLAGQLNTLSQLTQWQGRPHNSWETGENCHSCEKCRANLGNFLAKLGKFGKVGKFSETIEILGRYNKFYQTFPNFAKNFLQRVAISLVSQLSRGLLERDSSPEL